MATAMLAMGATASTPLAVAGGGGAGGGGAGGVVGGRELVTSVGAVLETAWVGVVVTTRLVQAVRPPLTMAEAVRVFRLLIAVVEEVEGTLTV